MKIKQTPLLTKLRQNPKALQEFFEVLRKREPEGGRDQVTIADTTYTVRRSPLTTRVAGY